MPYETRGLYYYGREQADERFSAETWVQRDICGARAVAVRRRPVRLRRLLADARGRARPGLGVPEICPGGPGRLRRGALAARGAELRRSGPVGRAGATTAGCVDVGRRPHRVRVQAPRHARARESTTSRPASTRPCPPRSGSHALVGGRDRLRGAGVPRGRPSSTPIWPTSSHPTGRRTGRGPARAVDAAPALVGTASLARAAEPHDGELAALVLQVLEVQAARVRGRVQVLDRHG